jgi:hypothetical protein
MNKYFCNIPYSYIQYGTLSCFIYAEDEEDCAEQADDCANRYSENYEDGDYSGDSEYRYSEMDIDLEESDVTPPGSPYENKSPANTPAAYFLAELSQL